VIVCHRRENGVAGVSVAKLIFARRHAFDGDEKPTAFGNPLRNRMWQLFADGQIDAASITKRPGRTTHKVGRVTPCAPSWQTRTRPFQALAGRGLPALPTMDWLAGFWRTNAVVTQPTSAADHLYKIVTFLKLNHSICVSFHRNKPAGKRFAHQSSLKFQPGTLAENNFRAGFKAFSNGKARCCWWKAQGFRFPDW